MQVTERKQSVMVPEEVHRVTEEELQQLYDYSIAEILTQKLAQAGLISHKEAARLRKKNCEVFQPDLASLLP